MNRRHFIAAATAAPAFAQTMYAPKGQPAVYTGPHRAHTKLSELKAKEHSGLALSAPETRQMKQLELFADDVEA